MKIKLGIICLLLGNLLIAQNTYQFSTSEVDIPTTSVTIKGTLLSPIEVKNKPLVILIPGSGPTDRDGNNAFMKNNSLKLLAEALSENNIATYRYDKSVLSLSKKDTLEIKNLTLNTFIQEAKTVIKYFKNQPSFSKIIVAGHSQGSLVGMIASKNEADAFISLEGAGRTIDKIIISQIQTQAPYLKDETIRILNELKKGKLVTDYNPILASLFNKTIQPFLISWINYNPQLEIKKLKIPVLIIQGTADIQTSVQDGILLSQSVPQATFDTISKMNHLFKIIKGNILENKLSYNNPSLPISDKLTQKIVKFINELK
ncbi:MAG: alpha/beta hydrolase [Lutibacter sp.]